MPIPLDEQEIVTLPEVPAVPEVVASLMHPETIIIKMPHVSEGGSLVIEYYPKTEAGQILRRDAHGADLVRRMSTDTLFDDLAHVPEMAAAFAAVRAAMKPFQAYRKTKEA